MEDSPEIKTAFFQLLTYLPLVLISISILGNAISFAIFRFHSKFKSNSTMVYLSFVSITDTLSLFGWELDHYLNFHHYMSIFTINKIICKLSWFNQFFSLQSSAMLLSMMCIDRSIHVLSMPGSKISRLPFRTAKSAFCWSLLVIFTISLINSHILILGCSKLNQTINSTQLENVRIALESTTSYENGFLLYPTWEKIHTVIYLLLPLTIIVLSNFLSFNTVIRSVLYQAGQQNNLNKRNSVLLTMIVNIVFLGMALPTSIVSSFNITTSATILLLLDQIAFSNHASLFFICFLSHSHFRLFIINSFKKFFISLKSMI